MVRVYSTRVDQVGHGACFIKDIADHDIGGVQQTVFDNIELFLLGKDSVAVEVFLSSKRDWDLPW